LMASEKLFDISQEPQAMRDKYGPTLFAEQALIARRLVEAGVPFVKVSRAWWDSHGQNFETHLELVSDSSGDGDHGGSSGWQVRGIVRATGA